MDKVAVSRSVTRLAERGYLTRSVDEEDRRRSQLSLSEEGQAIYARIVPLARQYEARLLAGISPEHRALLDELLADLQRAAEALYSGN